MDSKKIRPSVLVRELTSSSCSTLATLSSDKAGGTKERTKHTTLEHDDRNPSNPAPIEPHITILGKGRELLAFSGGCARTYLSDLPSRHKSLSKEGDFAHYVVQPWYQWFGRNKRVTTSPTLNTIRLRTCDGSHGDKTLINGGSFNYAGMYSMSAKYEELHRRCLEDLPVSGRDVPLIEDALRKEVMEFWGMDCCLTTPTGYQSNMLALPAILTSDWLVLMDEKSHSSILTAARIANTGGRRRFKHNDMCELEEMVRVAAAEQYTNVMIVVEGLYSLDGNLPDLGSLYRLKTRYDFVLVCDEAHSFLSIGKTGRGCLEWWNDTYPDDSVPEDLIDIRTTTLSKAVGGVGGIVCAKQQFAERLASHDEELKAEGESLSTSAMLQALWVLRQPQRLCSNLHRVRAMSMFCRHELQRAGVMVYGEPSMPILPIHGGRPTKASKLSYELRKHGVAATPFSKPAVPMWQSRVRIGMSAGFSDAQVGALIDAIIRSCEAAGVVSSNVVSSSRRPFAQHVAMAARHPCYDLLEQETQNALDSLHSLLDAQKARSIALAPRLDADARSPDCLPQSMIDAGHIVRRSYGLGSGSSRWILGTYPAHLEVEDLLCKATSQTAAMTYTNTEAGLMSSVAAVCRTIKGRKNHRVLRPAISSRAIVDGCRIARQSSGVLHAVYEGIDDMLDLAKISLAGGSHVTLIVDLAFAPKDFLAILTQRLLSLRSKLKHLTVFLANIDIAQICSRPSSCALQELVALCAKFNAGMLLFGSFFDTFGLKGAFLAGDCAMIEELRYTSRCYVFTAAPAPYMMAMVSAALVEKLS
ncbi:hypothetical protein LTR78_001643 [Recurvomyces mirabilis]|uniref:serine C-palmitoyltransferase n=1 Tax=Recurvomyces mirabilis TaxID=574656 RepID=A0AAE0WV22_9PEZI|nr:hypothetical protein LTR78_001643 [Recurvomyces mirabilis]KAK5151787.1 hypothetical protein LTS14_008919 [Recurvomyces mirabilis]